MCSIQRLFPQSLSWSLPSSSKRRNTPDPATHGVSQQRCHCTQSVQGRSQQHPTFLRSTGIISHWWHLPLKGFIWHTHSGHKNIHKGAHKTGWATAPHRVLSRPHHLVKLLGIIWPAKGHSTLTLSRNHYWLFQHPHHSNKLNNFEALWGSQGDVFFVYKFYLSPLMLLLTNQPTLNEVPTNKRL